MPAVHASPESHWYWSQRGMTMGPISFEELLRLVELRSVTAATWIYHPQQQAWVQAQTIPELTDAMRKATPGGSPSGAPPELAFCRFCGAAGPANANHCATCGRASDQPAPAGQQNELAAVLCRTSVLVTAVFPILPIVVPAIVWASDTTKQSQVREAKAALNCHIVLALLWLFVGWLSLFGVLVIVGPCIAVLLAFALAIYSVIAGVLGLLALGRSQPFEYPLMPRLIR